MRRPVTLVTGAGGEIGHGLITRMAQGGRPIVTVDIAPLDPALGRMAFREFTGSITDPNLLERILAEFEVDLVVHLAALLSTRAEFTPITAHHVNVAGVRPARRRIARPPGHVPVPLVDCRVRPS
jgi:nucleoside-diphosphate-sugar epimerase